MPGHGLPVFLASRQGQIRAASFLGGLHIRIKPIPEGEPEKRAHLDGSGASVGMLATGDGAIPKEGGQGPEEVVERPSQAPTEAPRGCVVHKPERARAEQREPHGRRGASRHGAKRVLVPADSQLDVFRCWNVRLSHGISADSKRVAIAARG